jgi:hypothetical protein
MVIPVVIYGCKSCTAKDWQQLQSPKINFLWRIKGSALKHHHTNSSARVGLEISAVRDRIQDYRSKWRQQLEHTGKIRLPKTVLSYCPRGKRYLGRPRKRWSFQYSWVGPAHWPILWGGGCKCWWRRQHVLAISICPFTGMYLNTLMLFRLLMLSLGLH